MDMSFAPPGDEWETPQPRLRESGDLETEPRAPGTIYKASIGLQVDNNLPRDNMFVTPHFRDVTGATSPAALATQLANNVVSWLGSPFRGQVKIYLEDFNPGVPHNPLATADFGTVGTFVTSSGPREIALCLSYYASQNTKRYRGRLYLPHAWLRDVGGNAPIAPQARPNASFLTKAIAFATVVLKPTALNGIEWHVASTVDKVSRRVTDFWVDDEWDIQRKRGYRGTTRQTGTT